MLESEVEELLSRCVPSVVSLDPDSTNIYENERDLVEPRSLGGISFKRRF